MTYQERCDCIEATKGLRAIAEQLKAISGCTSSVHFARQYALAVARNLDVSLVNNQPEGRNELDRS